MFQYTIVQWLFFFYFYCFCGWCFESAYVSIKEKHFVNRGFMKGPFLPLYGSGAIMMLVVSKPFETNLVLVYLAGCVGATILEYVTGVVMEAIFRVRYWDYSNQKFQFQGHICLSSSLTWGALTILMTRLIHPVVEAGVLAIPSMILSIVTYLLTAVLFADFAISFKEALDMRDVLVKLEKAKEEIVRLQKRLDVVIALTNEELSGRMDEFVEKTGGLAGTVEEAKAQLLAQMKEHMTTWEAKKTLLAEHIEKRMGLLFKHNPSMTSKRFEELLEELKKRIVEHKGE